jgi:hypothetical protein
MSHAEMVALLPGTFLASEASMSAVIGKLDDAFIQIHGKLDDLHLILKISPMNPEDAELTMMNAGNLNLFVKSPLLDRRVSQFRDNIVGDSLYIEVEFFRENVKRDEVRAFVNQCLVRVEFVCDAAIRHLKSLRPKR